MMHDLFETQLGNTSISFRIDDHLNYFYITTISLAAISFILFKRATWWNMLKCALASILISILFLFLTDYVREAHRGIGIIHFDLEDKVFYVYLIITSFFVLSFLFFKRSKWGITVFSISCILFLIFFFKRFTDLQKNTDHNLGDGLMFFLISILIGLLLFITSYVYWRFLKIKK